MLAPGLPGDFLPRDCCASPLLAWVTLLVLGRDGQVEASGNPGNPGTLDATKGLGTDPGQRRRAASQRQTFAERMLPPGNILGP